MDHHGRFAPLPMPCGCQGDDPNPGGAGSGAARDGDSWEDAIAQARRDGQAYVCGRGVPVQDAEDVVHEALCSALVKRYVYDSRGPTIRWLMGFIRVEVLKWLTNKRREVSMHVCVDPHECYEDSRKATRLDPDLIDQLLCLLRAAPGDRWEVLQARYFDGLSWKEIAERTGRTPKAERLRVDRALSWLRTVSSKMRAESSRKMRS